MATLATTRRGGLSPPALQMAQSAHKTGVTLLNLQKEAIATRPPRVPHLFANGLWRQFANCGPGGGEFSAEIDIPVLVLIFGFAFAESGCVHTVCDDMTIWCLHDLCDDISFLSIKK
jgi:hypothetical protein